jgi:hypothetical protein
MTTPGYDYKKAIPAGFYDEIHQHKAGVRLIRGRSSMLRKPR